ncbi:MAG: mucoidy inhibitor MuiA family protein, partial [Candidatus Brocadiia bacterium]
ILTASLLALILCNTSTAMAETGALSAKVVSVTVLPDRAEEISTVDADFVAGYNRIMIRNFSPSVDFSSLRLKVLADADVMVTAMTIASVPIPEGSSEKLQDLQQRINALQDLITVLNDSIKILSIKGEYAARLLENTRKAIGIILARGEALPANLAEKVDYLTSIALDCRNKIAEAQMTLADKKKALDDLQREVAASYGPSRKAETTAIVELQATAACKGTIELKYLVWNSAWYPTYEVNVTPDTKQVVVTYAAIVGQATGADWDGVSLTLATSTPSMSLVPPTPQPWIVSYQVPVPPPVAKSPGRSGGKRKSNAPSQDKEEMEKKSGDAPEAEFARVMEAGAVQEGGLAVSFALPGKMVVPSGSTVKFQITQVTFAAEVRDFAVPAVSPAAFIRAVFTNTSDFPFLPGVARCFVDGALTGTTYFARIMPGTEVKLALGIERRVKMERKTVTDKLDERGGKLRRVFEYKIELTNNSDKAIPYELRERIPISDDDDIKVGGMDFSDKPFEQTADGFVTWKFELGAKEKKIIVIKYYVEWPKDKAIFGL